MQQHRVDTQILHEEQILEAIDQLRRRKARPDADRICNYLLRKFSVDARDTIADLHRLIEAEKVIQVDYKGNTSYRNASKWSRLQLYKNRPEGFVKEKLNSSMIAGAVAELVVEEPDYLDQGVPAYRLVEQLLDGVSNPTSRRMVEDFLSKEVASGNIAKLSNGNYSLVATTDTTSSGVVETNATTSIPDTTTSAISMSNSDALSASAHQQNNYNNNINGNNNNNHNHNNNNHNNNIEEQEEEQLIESSNSGSRCYAVENGRSEKFSYCLPTAITTTTISTTTTESERDAEGGGGGRGGGGGGGAAESGGETSSKTSITTRNEKISQLPGLYDFEDNEDEVMVTDSRSNTPRSSQGNSSPRQINDNNANGKNISKEECYEITIIGKEPDSPEESVTKDDVELRDEDSLNLNIETRKNVTKINKESNNSNLKKSSKSERKQRLLVRSEDPMDIEIKFEDFGRDNKDDRDKQHRDLDIGQHSDERDDDDAGRSSTNPSPTPSNTTVAAFRSARRKRAKKVFDPSDNNVVKRKRGRPVSQNKNIHGSQESQESTKSLIKEGPSRQCSLCAKEKSENLVACRDCTVRAHPSCIYPPDELLQKSGSSWQCERCKSCMVCCETSDIGPLVTCYTCDEAYHFSCHVPRVSSSKANSKWQCSECSEKHNQGNVGKNTTNLSVSRPDTPSNPPALPPVLSPQVSPNRASSEQMEDETGTRDGIDPNIPDASDWTSEQVYQYFARLFPKEAEVFRLQDIDGHSLLLMKRSDVLSGLDLLLGPALKIYRHVLKLQMRRDDSRLYWL